MRTFDDVLGLPKAVCLNWGILFFTIVVSGAFLAPTDSNAQAVPPRVQSLMLNRPLVLPPEPPLQKEIGELRREVRERPPQIINRYYPVPVPVPENIRFLENQIRKMEYQIAVLQDELSRLRQELRRRQQRQ